MDASNLTGRTVGVLIGIAVAAYTRSFFKGLATAGAIDFVVKRMGMNPQLDKELEAGATALSALAADYLNIA